MVLVDTTVWIDFFTAKHTPEHKIALLHNNRDFDPIEAHCGLKVVKASRKVTKPPKPRPLG